MYFGYMAVVLLLATLTGFIPGYLTSIIRPIKQRSLRSTRDQRSSSILNFQSRPESRTRLEMFQTTYLECSVRSHPPAVIYWLKDGRRLTNNTYELEENINNYVRSVVSESEAENVGDSGRSLTVSRLTIRCAGQRDDGRYRCVAENGYDKMSAETQVHVRHTNEVWSAAGFKHCSKNYVSGAKVNMWSDSFVAIEGSTIRLVCRSSGLPKPKVTWYYEAGVDQLYKIHNDEKYQVLKNGDLVIRDLSWESDMGQFKCKAQNKFGSDDISAFVYAVAK